MSSYLKKTNKTVYLKFSVKFFSNIFRLQYQHQLLLLLSIY